MCFSVLILKITFLQSYTKSIPIKTGILNYNYRYHKDEFKLQI